MSCAACQARVEKAVSKVPGVSECAVSLLTNSMGVEGTADEAAIIKAVEDAGYGAVPRGKERQENAESSALSEQERLAREEEALADHETPKLKKRLVSSIAFLLVLMYVSMGHVMWGWPIIPFFQDNPIGIALLEAILALIVMIINRKFFISGFKSLIHLAPNMDTLVAMGSGVSYAWSIVVLFAMTRAAADGQPLHSYLHELYFESAAMILALITVGKMLEAMSKGRTTDALKSLMKLSPKSAVVERDGSEISVPIDQVRVGDTFVVRPGESIPVDGVVVDGISAVNESALTGESVPVDKEPGSTVSAATINQSGFLRCRASRVGSDTTLSQIIQMVSDAASTKAPIAKVADRVSAVFVPAVMVIAAVTFIIWMVVSKDMAFSLARGISVLVISCPCALGLATPVAIMVGNGMGAKNGILFKTASALEQTGRTQIIALDKTGTITSGEMRVTDLVGADGISEEQLLAAAAGVEKMSEHPLAKAVVKAAQDRDVPMAEVTGFQALPGSGVRAELTGLLQTDATHVGTAQAGTAQAGTTRAGTAKAGTAQAGTAKVEAVRADITQAGTDPAGAAQTTAIQHGNVLTGGSLKYMSENVSVPEDIRRKAVSLAEEGKTPLLFAAGKKLIGIIAVADTIKDDSPQAIRELRDMGIHVVMLTGDNERTARAVGRNAGVDEVVAGVLPDGKEAVIRSLQEKGKVAMVGDGINDAPALTRADIGIAIGAGTDVAIDSADVVLMNSRLSDVPAAIRLSRQTLKNIHENLFWAFFYNTILIPVAAGAWYAAFGLKLNPMIGAAAMSLSSFCVVTNALRLNLFDIRKTGHDRKIRQSFDFESQADPDPQKMEETPADAGSDTPMNTGSVTPTDIGSERAADAGSDTPVNAGSDTQSQTDKKEGNKMAQKTMKIEGMMCEHCEARVKKVLEKIDQVDSAQVSHTAGTAIVQLNAPVDNEVLKQAVEDQDYKVLDITD